MQKKTFLLAIALFGIVQTNLAQQQHRKKTTLGEKVSKLIKQTKKDLEQAGHELGDAIGFDDCLKSKSDLRRINGTYYMPLYDTDLYKGDSALVFRTTCTKLFRKKYPKANIMSVVIPQKEWLLENVEKAGEIIGYQKTLYCYIVARDGDEGYINAKFMYCKNKMVGHHFQPLLTAWPRWERTDIITNSVYQQLLQK